ncbi:MAG: beta-ketoacyl synthase [Telmatospirillum sp.]|nr:beta-ketoacyl synthase [Telmatospirillum sp.]
MFESDIAIIGMSCRFPGADDIETLWRDLAAGREAIRPIGDPELVAAGVDPEQLADPAYVKAGAFIDGVDLFDADFFGITREEAELTDPQQRLFLECAFEALERAGYGATATEARVGVYAGMGLNSYGLFNLAERFRRASSVGRYQIMLANDKDFAATRVSYRLNLRGPGIGINTACSTSLVAVHMACLGLLAGDCDMALVGGAHVAVPHHTGYRYQDGMIFSPDGHCRAFDARAKGTVIGSGVGVVALKPLSRALEDGDWVHAVIKGTAINNDGASKPGYTAPSVSGQVEVIVGAQEAAGCPPESISYVEAHGTGTPLGDPIEVAALTEAFGRGPRGSGPVALGSVKTNLGHLDVAAGMAGLIKTALMLEHRTLVPSLHYEPPNPEIDFAGGPFEVATETRPWASGPTPRRAGVSSFGIGGTNAHVVLEEAPEIPPAAAGWTDRLLILSGRTPESLEKAANRLARHLKEHPGLDLASVAQTLALGRRAHRHRLALIADDIRDAALALALRDPGRSIEGDAGADRAPLFVLSDDGEGLAFLRTLQDGVEPLRAALERCAGLLDLSGGGAALLESGGPLAAFAGQYAIVQALGEWGVRPSAVAGSGVAGDLLALHLAGAVPLEECLRRAAGRMVGTIHPGPAALPLFCGRTGAAVDAGALAARMPGNGAGAASLSTAPLARESLAAGLSAAGFTPVLLCPGRERSGGTSFLLSLLAGLWVAGAAIDWTRVRGGAPIRRTPLPATPFLRQRYWVDPVRTETAADGADDHGLTIWRDAYARADGAGRRLMIADFLRAEIASVLGIAAAEVDAEARFFDLGIESLAFIQIAAKLGDALEIPVAPSSFVEHPTLRQFVDHVGADDADDADGPREDDLEERLSTRARLRQGNAGRNREGATLETRS